MAFRRFLAMILYLPIGFLVGILIGPLLVAGIIWAAVRWVSHGEGPLDTIIEPLNLLMPIVTICDKLAKKPNHQ